MTLSKYDSYIDKIIQWLYIVNKYDNNKYVKDLSNHQNFFSSIKIQNRSHSTHITNHQHPTRYFHNCY